MDSFRNNALYPNERDAVTGERSSILFWSFKY